MFEVCVLSIYPSIFAQPEAPQRRSISLQADPCLHLHDWILVLLIHESHRNSIHYIR